MLLTGFDSKFLNTLYVDKNLKHHGLIQAFSRTNWVLNATKPYGNILDFRQQQAVDAAIALFSARPLPKKPVKSGWSTKPPWLSRNWKARSRSSMPSCSRRGSIVRPRPCPT